MRVPPAETPGDQEKPKLLNDLKTACRRNLPHPALLRPAQPGRICRAIPREHVGGGRKSEIRNPKSEIRRPRAEALVPRRGEESEVPGRMPLIVAVQIYRRKRSLRRERNCSRPPGNPLKLFSLCSLRCLLFKSTAPLRMSLIDRAVADRPSDFGLRISRDYCSSLRTLCGSALAWASMAVPDWTRML